MGQPVWSRPSTAQQGGSSTDLPTSVSASTSLLIACGYVEARVSAIAPPADQPLHPDTAR